MKKFLNKLKGDNMNVYLKDIDESNWEKCISLTTNKNGKHFILEEFTASNAVSIAQGKIEKGWTIKAVYSEDTMVGFVMYGYCYEDNIYEICRLMIDYKYQGRGYGKAALEKVIQEMKDFENCNEIFLSFDPENNIGQRLYESFGFKDTGNTVEGELLYSLSLK